MERDQLLGLIDLQHDRHGFISRVVLNARKSGDDKSVLGLENRLAILESYWSQYELDHVRIRTSRDEAIRSSDYVKKRAYDDTQEVYLARKLELRTLLETLSASTAGGGAEEKVESAPAVTPEVSLPRIPIPTFTGAFDEWRNYRDLFASLVTDNARLAPIQKLHYLKQSGKGEPERLLRNYPLSSDGFEAAWLTLLDRYDNARILVDGYLGALFALQPIGRETVAEVKRLLDRTVEIRAALRQLDYPVQHWDAILVHLTASKLDARMRREWEHTISDDREPVAWDTLAQFLIARLRGLEAVDQGARRVSEVETVPQRRPSHKPVGSTISARHVTEGNKRPCPQCARPHPLWECSKFRSLTTANRESRVRNWGRCGNCLSAKHPTGDCTSSRRCRTCGQAHHTLLHPEREPSTGASVTVTATSTGTTAAPRRAILATAL